LPANGAALAVARHQPPSSNSRGPLRACGDAGPLTVDPVVVGLWRACARVAVSDARRSPPAPTSPPRSPPPSQVRRPHSCGVGGGGHASWCVAAVQRVPAVQAHGGGWGGGRMMGARCRERRTCASSAGTPAALTFSSWVGLHGLGTVDLTLSGRRMLVGWGLMGMLSARGALCEGVGARWVATAAGWECRVVWGGEGGAAWKHDGGEKPPPPPLPTPFTSELPTRGWAVDRRRVVVGALSGVGTPRCTAERDPPGRDWTADSATV
jgi:hypothetical protein